MTRKHRTPTRFIATAFVAAFAIGFACVPAVAAETIPSGTSISATLSSPDIRTNKNQVGDPFTAHVVGPYATKYLRGAVVHGHVARIRSAGQGRTAKLELSVDSLVFADGIKVPASAYSTSIAEVKDNTTTRKALGAGVGAAVGSQTVGRLLGGALGGVVGIAGGAAAGYAYAKNNRPNFDVPTGATVVFQVAQTIDVPRPQAR
jgi:hypothetical protein